MLPGALRALGVASLLGALGGCELFWSWDGVGNGGGSAPRGAGCASATALVCDDFEHDDAVNPWHPYTSPGGTVGIDAMQAHSGHRALHATTDEGVPVSSDFQGILVAGWQQALSASPATLYLRIYVFPANAVAGFESFAELEQTGGSGDLAGLWMSPSSYGWLDNVSGGIRQTSTPLPAGTWTCVEWEFDASSATARVWIDGQAVPELTQSIGWFAPNQLEIGQRVSPAQTEQTAGQTNDVWLDDVVLDVQRVGCQ
jgi:hypothetical protein